MALLMKCLTITLASVALAGLAYNPISGHDFEIDVVYPSGISFSTTEPPNSSLPLSEILSNDTLPQLTLRNLPTPGNDSTGKYISFVVLTHVGQSLYQPELGEQTTRYMSWIRVNQTLSADGTTLGGGDSDERNGRSELRNVGAFTNGSLHVWQQTENVTEYLFKNRPGSALWWELGDLWSNSTLEGVPPFLVSYDFARANIDFDVRNDTVVAVAESAAIRLILSKSCLALLSLVLFLAG